jgi:hypothetical protein
MDIHKCRLGADRGAYIGIFGKNALDRFLMGSVYFIIAIIKSVLIPNIFSWVRKSTTTMIWQEKIGKHTENIMARQN